MAIFEKEQSDVKQFIALYVKGTEIQVGTIWPSSKTTIEDLHDSLQKLGATVEIKESGTKLDSFEL